MAKVSQNVAGVDLNNKITPGTTIKPLFKTGQTVIGDNGKLFQYCKANATIAASDADCLITVSSGEYVVAASGGTSVSPPVAMASGDYAWFQI